MWKFGLGVRGSSDVHAAARATILPNRNVTLADGAMAFAVLVGLQFVVMWLSVRFRPIRQFVTGEPRMLFHRGKSWTTRRASRG